MNSTSRALRLKSSSLERTGTLQGKVIRVGGRQDIVSVDIQDVDGHVYVCRAKRDTARRLAKEIFEQTVRVRGTGKWARDGDGTWFVDSFLIEDFEPLEDDSFTSVVDEIRKINSPWQGLEDPEGKIDRIRNGDAALQ